MKKILVLLLGLLFVPSITNGYSFYSSFTSITTIQVNTVVNVVYPQTQGLCYSDKAFDESKNYLQYLSDYDLRQVEQKLANIKSLLYTLNNSNFTKTERVAAPYPRRAGASAYNYVQVYDYDAYNRAKDEFCDAQADFAVFVNDAYVAAKKDLADKALRIGEYLKKGDTYANEGKYEEAVSAYESANKELKSLKGVDSIMVQIETAIKELKIKQEEKLAQELTDQYIKALEYGKNEYYDAAIKGLEVIIKNEGKIKWDNYEEAKKFLNEFKKGKDLYFAAKKEQEEAQALEEELKENQKVAEAKAALGKKAAIFDSLVPLFKAKDQKTQENVKALLKTFTQSKDAYTKNIGLYFGYLIQ